METDFPGPERKDDCCPSSGSEQGYRLWPGASWITPAGESYRISGFHDRWLVEHRELARGTLNVAEMIRASGWVAATLYSEGILELIVEGGRNESSLDIVFEILSRNRGLWSLVRIMALDSAGLVVISEGDFRDRTSLDAAEDGVWGVPEQ